MDPDKALSLLERAGALGVLCAFVYAGFKGKVIFGWVYDKLSDERDDYKKRYLDKVDPPAKTDVK